MNQGQRNGWVWRRGLRQPGRVWRVAAIGALLLAAPSALASMGAAVTLASGQPGLIYPSETTQLEITLSNSNTTSAVNGVAFSNTLPGTLPNGLKIAGAATYTCFNPTIFHNLVPCRLSSWPIRWCPTLRAQVPVWHQVSHRQQAPLQLARLGARSPPMVAAH